uniref:RGS domain-containing protein n=1 Tax=Cyprinus carpio TaxID=7962 RepID=A0A8C1LYL4_CYPCA
MIQPSGAFDDIMSFCGDVGVVFSEDTPRPPVPGEEGCEGGVYSSKTASHWSEAPVASVRRSDVDLGFEPEGSAPPDGPYEPWAETLLTLLEDRDGTALFLRFLQTLGCAPLLEFWFACSGFQKVPEDATERRLKLARAMYRCYLCDGLKMFTQNCLITGSSSEASVFSLVTYAGLQSFSAVHLDITSCYFITLDTARI